MSLMLCVDPGLANVGAVVVRPSTGEVVQMFHFKTEKIDTTVKWRHSDDRARRVQALARFYHGVILGHGIRRAAAELPSGGAPNSQAACDLAYASAALVSVLEVGQVAVEWYTPGEVKSAAAGRRTASKDEVMAAMEAAYPDVLTQFPNKGRREHVCDALGVWLCARHGSLARL